MATIGARHVRDQWSKGYDLGVADARAARDPLPPSHGQAAIGYRAGFADVLDGGCDRRRAHGSRAPVDVRTGRRSESLR